ncbi:hypothetical protein SXCC_00221 [Gluconacetobacter sp. SXCC-1]|nr:hypothetical protein SXCC_00221 [Gluconacetobacter sp. SXCC-1]
MYLYVEDLAPASFTLVLNQISLPHFIPGFGEGFENKILLCDFGFRSL